MTKKLTTGILLILLCAVFLLSACDPQVTSTAEKPAAAASEAARAEATPAPEPSATAASESTTAQPSASQSGASATPAPQLGEAQATQAPGGATETSGQVTPDATATPEASAAPAAPATPNPTATPMPSVTPEPAPTATPAQTSVQLQTSLGPVKGVQADGVSMYKGIPYAMPPTDDLRFAPPQDAQPWTDVLDCTAFGDIAVQNTVGEGLEMSEDCLTLNVWTPAESDSEKLPVYVWIHGGGFAQGSGAEPMYDGTNFAQDGIVVVTINYRLNAIGFFASQETYDEYGTTGNWGLLDQIKALEWVQENIAAFGGDPSQVTIGGESAGSYSVSGLISSPLAEGLFQRAIMESGSMLGVPGNCFYSRGNLQRSIELDNMMAFTFAATDDASGLEKLRAADANVLAQLSPLNVDFTTTPAFMMTPVFDGYVMPTDPYGALQNGQFNDVDLLWGYNANEGSIFVPGDTDELTYEMLAARMYGYVNQKAVLARFPVDEQNPSGERAREILGYGMFNAVMKPYGDALAGSGQNVYAYQFNYSTADNEKAGLGAHHGSEIAYAFGTLENPDAEQQALSEEMHARWANFIKTGDPNQGDVPSAVQWPAYDPDGSQMLVFDTTVTAGAMAGKDDIEFMEDIMFGSGAAYK